jgi:TIR domain
MKVVIVEDDYLQAEHIRSWLLEVWPHIEIEAIQTEAEFRSKLPDLSAQPPNIVIMDYLLRWSDPRPDAHLPPDEVKAAGFYGAGLRCIDLLQQNDIMRSVPVVLYTVLERSDIDESILRFPPNVKFLHKASEKDRLIQLVGSFVAAQKPIGQLSSLARDVFICHASEDKETIVEPLVKAFEDAGITVWHDKAEVRWGDSLVSKIEEGLRISRFVLAVLSKNSVRKPWPRRELNAALNREASSGEIKVLHLIVGSADEREEILIECALQSDKLYEVWTGSPMPIVRRLKERLRSR